MAASLIFKNLFIWMYFIAPLLFLKIWSDIIWFLYYFFSIRLLATTLFSKWKQIGESRKGRGFFEDYVAPFIINSLMRIVGFMVRSIVIVFGVLTILTSVIFGAVLFVAWFFFPVIFATLLIVGLRFLLL